MLFRSVLRVLGVMQAPGGDDHGVAQEVAELRHCQLMLLLCAPAPHHVRGPVNLVEVKDVRQRGQMPPHQVVHVLLVQPLLAERSPVRKHSP